MRIKQIFLKMQNIIFNYSINAIIKKIYFKYIKDKSINLFYLNNAASNYSKHWNNFMRAEITASNQLNNWIPFNFKDKIFLEIGNGLTGGLIPCAIFLGAKRCYGVDPDWCELNKSEEIHKVYYSKYYEFLSSIYGNLISYDNFIYEIKNVKVYKDKLKNIEFNEKIDLIWSLSCLEHIESLPISLNNLHKYTHNNTRHIHIVDYGNHMSKDAPFKNLYEYSKDEYINKMSNHINLLRYNEIMNLLKQIFSINTKSIIIDKRSIDHIIINKDYLNTSNYEDLKVRVSYFYV